MAKKRHAAKKKQTKIDNKNSRENGGVAFEIKVSARSRMAAKTSGGRTAAKKRLPEKEREKIVKRIMSREQKRGRKRRGKKEAGGSSINETEQVERQKRIIMWSGVTFFMVIIAVFWIYIFKLNVSSSYSPPAHNASLSSNLQNMTDELEKQMNQINQTVDKINTLGREGGAKNATSSAIFGVSSGLPNDDIQGALKQLENKLKNSD